MLLEKRKHFKEILLSSLFIFFTTLLFLRVSAEFYILFGMFPLILIGLSSETKITLKSFFLSYVILNLLFFFNYKIIDSRSLSYFVINLSSIFILSLIITTCLKFEYNGKTFSLGKSMSYYILTICFLLFFFLKFYYINQDFSSYLSEIKSIYLNQLNIKNLELEKQIESLISNIFKIFPSINIFLFLIITFFNLFICQKIVEKYEINIVKKINFNIYEITDWYFYFSFLSFLTLFLFFNTITLNISLVFASLFILKGLGNIFNFFSKKKLPVYMKFLLLFLLFIFFSYLLLIFLFFLGFYQKLREVIKNF